MKVHEYREMMRYLTRKPLSDREVELAYTDHLQKLNAPSPMPVASGEELGTQLELAAGGVVERENYKLGSDFIKDVYKANNISGIRVKKADSGNIYIAGRYTDKDGQRVTTGAKTFNPKTATQKEVTDFLNQTKRQLKGKTYGSATEAILGTAKAKLDYTELRKEYVNDLMEWLDEASKNPKYKTSEQLQKDLFKQFNQPKYTEVPNGVHNKSIFFQDGKFSIPRETEIFERKVGSQKVPEKTVNDLSDFFLLKNNSNFEKVRDTAYDFFTNKKADINKLPAEQQKILRNFSRDFIKGQIKGEAGESIFLSGLKQEGFNFQNKVNEALYIKSLKEKIREELSNPNISQNRKNFLNKQLETISEQRNSILKDIYQSHPNLYKAAQHPGNFVYEHKLPRYIGDMINLPYDYLARATFSPNAFNKFKFENFDKPLGALITEYNNAGDVASKSEIKNEIESLYNDFNKKTKVKGQGYLDELKFEFGNKVKVKDNTPLISDLTTEDVYRDILRNVKHSNQYFKNEKLNKYVVEGEDFNAFTKDLTNRVSKNKGAFYSFPGQAAESELLGTLAGRAGTVVSEYSRFVGGPIMATLGAGLNYPEMREKGFGKAESLGIGAIKAFTQDTFNFILDTLPMPAKYSAKGAVNDVAKEMEAKGENPYVEGTGGLKVLDVTKFDWNRFAEKHPGFFQFINKAADYVSEKLPTKYKVENIIEHEIKKDPNAPFKSQYYDIYDPRLDTEKLSSEEENKYKEKIRKQLFKQNPDVEKEYNKQDINPISAGPVYLGTEQAQELKVGGRVGYKEGSDDGYTQEIPSLGFSDPIDILEQQMINEKNIDKILALDWQLTEMKERKFEQETKAAEYKKSQKEKGVRYKEDFPSEAAYFAETGKQLLTNPKYFLGKGAKGVVEGTEWLVGQPLKTLFNQEGKNFEFYHPVAGEKLGINKYIEENIPKNPTTGTLFAGETAEIAGSVMDPFLAYGLAKGAIKGTKAKPPTAAVEEKIDPTRRDILKTGAVMGGGALLYPTAKKLGMFDELAKGAKAIRVLPKVKGMPVWFNPLVTRMEREGLDITSEVIKLKKLEYEKLGYSSDAGGIEVVQAKKLEIPVIGKKEPEIVKMIEYKNGDILIESNTSGGAFNSSFDLYYNSPKEIIDETTKKKITRPGDFVIFEDRPQYVSPQFYGDDALELERMEIKIDDSISDLEKLEEIGTGKKPNLEKIKKRKENKEYVEKNPRDDADSRLPEPEPDYDRGSYIKDND